MGKLPPAVRLLGLGWYIALCIGGLSAAGVLLDQVVEMKPVFTLLGLGVGLVTALGGGYILLIKFLYVGSKDSQKDG